MDDAPTGICQINPSPEDSMEFAVVSSSIEARDRSRIANGMVRLAMLCVMLTLSAMPAGAASRFSPEDVAACKALSERAAELIRAGQSVITTRKQLRRCVRILRAEKRRAGQARQAPPKTRLRPYPSTSYCLER